MATARPRNMKSEPSVMMNDGSFVVRTRTPFRNPATRARTSATRTAGHRDHPHPPPLSGVTRIMITIPDHPSSDPTERSNSPPIINIETAMASRPSGAALLRIAAVVPQLTKALSEATTAKNSHTTTVATIAPNSGRTSRRVSVLTRRTRSSAAAGGAVCVVTRGSSLPWGDLSEPGPAFAGPGSSVCG